MAKFKKVIVAGPLVVEAVYPAPHPRDSVSIRRGKQALSSQAQQRMNLKYAYQRLELLIAANFGAKDIFTTLTYEDAHLPGSRAESNKRVQLFLRKLRAYRKSKDQELHYIYVTEHKHGDGRWHHHLILDSTGDDYDSIRELWAYGSVDSKQIQIDRDHTYEDLARYLCKEQREKVGARLWSCSRNLSKPEMDCFRVPNDTPLVPPDGVVILNDTGDVITAYGHYRYMKYMAGGMALQKRPRAKRRRRKARE